MPILIDPGPSRRGWHRLQTFLECPQKYAWEYLRPSGGEKPVPKDGPRVIGSLTHVGIAHYYARLRETQHGRDPSIYHEPSVAIALLAEKNGWHQQDVEHVQDIVIDYIAHWSGREQWRVLYVEEVFEARYPFVEGPIRRKVRDERGVWTGEWREEEDALLTARVDLAIELAGKVYFVDHKCLPGDALVETAQGHLPVATLSTAGTSWTCLAWDGSHLVEAEAKCPTPVGLQDIFRIQLANGMAGEYGFRHPILTRSGWVQADALRPGMEVAVAMRACGREELESDALLAAAAMLLCDGSLTNEALTYTKNGPARAYYCAQLRALGVEPKERRGKGGRASYVQVGANSALHAGLDRLGVLRATSPMRFLPPAMLNVSDRQAGVVLGALWSGDGAAYLLDTKRKVGKKPVIVFSSSSRQFCEGVQQLLIQLGIPATVVASSISYKGEARPYYAATVVGRVGKRRFLELALRGDIKIAPNAHARQTRAGNPVPSLQEILANVEPAGIGAEGDAPKIEGDIWWVPVSTNLFMGQRECYDIEVPRHHTFVANGVVTHNTTGRIDVKHPKFYTMSGQLINYRWLGTMAFGEKFGGVLLNMVQTQGGRKFQRPPLEPAPALFNKFPQTIEDAERRIAQLEDEDRAVSAWPAATNELTCFHRYGACSHLERCKWGLL